MLRKLFFCGLLLMFSLTTFSPVYATSLPQEVDGVTYVNDACHVQFALPPADTVASAFAAVLLSYIGLNHVTNFSESTILLGSVACGVAALGVSFFQQLYGIVSDNAYVICDADGIQVNTFLQSGNKITWSEIACLKHIIACYSDGTPAGELVCLYGHNGNELATISAALSVTDISKLLKIMNVFYPLKNKYSIQQQIVERSWFVAAKFPVIVTLFLGLAVGLIQQQMTNVVEEVQEEHGVFTTPQGVRIPLRTPSTPQRPRLQRREEIHPLIATPESPSRVARANWMSDNGLRFASPPRVRRLQFPANGVDESPLMSTLASRQVT